MRPFIAEEHRETFVEIFESTPEQRLVTCVEALSPANKRPGTPGWEQYLRKRQSLLLSGIHLVEIDLLRGGRRLPLGAPPPDLRDYYILVLRSWLFPKADLWTFGLRDPLPEVPIPLDADVPEVSLPLRPCLDRAYQEGRYGSTLRYQRPMTPRPRAADAAWVRDILAARTSA